MKVRWISALNEEDPILKVINDGLIVIRIPPLRRVIVLSARENEPEILVESHLLDLVHPSHLVG
jgi:hypothetical protein